MATETLVQSVYTGGNHQPGTRDGFREQVILLDNLREKLDEYFSLRNLHHTE